MASKQISLLDAIDEKSHIPKKPLYYIDLGIHFKINIRANQDVLQYIFWTHNGAVYRPIVTCYGNRNFDNLKEFYARRKTAVAMSCLQVMIAKILDHTADHHESNIDYYS